MCIRDRDPHRTLALVGRFGIGANNCAQCTLRELRGPILRPFLGLCGSSSERLPHLCMLGWADCGLRQIAALAGRERIADYVPGSLP
eukprot:909738-Alexandrium_andersonii.AAC.1